MRATGVVVMGRLLAIGCAEPRPQPAPPAIAAPTPAPKTEVQTFSATAYSMEGRTASGARTRMGIVAADTKVLPLGSRIRVSDAGTDDGEYVVRDIGPAINGHEIDIYVPNDAEAKGFGRRAVKVEVLSRGGSD